MSQESPNQDSRLAQMREVIRTAREGVQAEFARTKNTWLECFGSRMFAVETYLDSPRLRAELSPEEYQNMLDRFDALKEKFFALKETYPDKATIPPEEMQDELFDALALI